MLKNVQELPFKHPKNMLCRPCGSMRPVLGHTCTSKHIVRTMPHARKALKCRVIACNLKITGKNALKMLINGQKLPFKPPKNLLCRLCRSVRPVLGRTCTSKHIVRAMPHAKKSVKMS